MTEREELEHLIEKDMKAVPRDGRRVDILAVTNLYALRFNVPIDEIVELVAKHAELQSVPLVGKSYS